MMVAGFFPAIEDESAIGELKGASLVQKDQSFATEINEKKGQTQQFFQEDERFGFVGSFPPIEGFNRSLETKGNIPNKKGGSLVSVSSGLGAPPFLGFGEASSTSINGGQGTVASPHDFKISEFLFLANRVVDGGDIAKFAETFWPATMTRKTFGRGTLKALHYLLGPATETRREDLRASGSTKNGSPPLGKKSQIPARLRDSSFGNQGNETVTETSEKLAGTIFQQTGEGPVTFTTNSNVRWAANVDATVERAGAKVVGALGDMEVDLASERAADISPIRADVITTARAAGISPIRADIIIDARAYISNYTVAEVSDARVISDDTATDISIFVGKKQHFHDMTRKKAIGVPVQTGLYVGNIPLHTCPKNATSDDKIAHVFNNS
ncbi:UNVERIFIED_CONTAM: hypothetical protein Sindi_2944900 [Sesamum indicum]